jgi:HEAT repeat protein
MMMDHINRLLLAIESGPDVDMWEAAKELSALDSLVADTVQSLVALLKAERPDTRAAAAYVLGFGRCASARGVLEEVVDDIQEEPFVRGHAAEALAYIPSKESVDVLLRHLTDESSDVKYWCAFALGQIGDDRAVPALTQLAERAREECHKGFSLRDEARDALAHIRQRQWYATRGVGMTSEDWNTAEREIVALLASGDVRAAIARIETVVSTDRGEFKGRALLYRGSIHEEQGRLQSARDDFAEAVRLFEAGSYVRYASELSLGQVCRVLGEPQSASTWYRAALETCDASIEAFSGGSALEGFLSMSPSPTRTDLTLIRSVITKSWKLLEVSGAPDVTDLKAASAVIKRHETQPR